MKTLILSATIGELNVLYCICLIIRPIILLYFFTTFITFSQIVYDNYTYSVVYSTIQFGDFVDNNQFWGP